MKKQQIIVVPLYMGDFYRPDSLLDNISTVTKYIKRALLFFGKKTDIAVFYPEDKQSIARRYVRNLAVSNVWLTSKEVRMEKYTMVDDTSFYIHNPGQLISQFTEILQDDAAQNATHAIYIISMCHVSHFLTAYRNAIGTTAEIDFSKQSEIGSTEVFYFQNDESNSVEHLCYHDHLDFFIPNNINDLTEPIMKLGKTIHRMSKRMGHTEFLERLAAFC